MEVQNLFTVLDITFSLTLTATVERVTAPPNLTDSHGWLTLIGVQPYRIVCPAPDAFSSADLSSSFRGVSGARAALAALAAAVVAST